MGLLLFGIKSVLQSMIPGFIVGGAAVATNVVGQGIYSEVQKRKALKAQIAQPPQAPVKDEQRTI